MMTYGSHGRAGRKEVTAFAPVVETPSAVTPEDRVIGLQRAIGNREVARLLGADGGAPVSIHHQAPIAIQARFRGPAGGNAHEVEADRVADQIALSRAAPGPGNSSTAALRHADTGGAALPRAVHSTIASPGRPLDAATRARMEPHFGVDLGAVRVHTDRQAAESARSVGAMAYAVGPHIAFDEGRYSPDSAAGSHLLAHELTHVVQQSNSGAASLDCAKNLSEGPPKFELGQMGDHDTVGYGLVLGGMAYAEGFQVYESSPNDKGCYSWNLLWPEAILYNAKHQRIGKHYVGPTWEMDDGSMIVADQSKEAKSVTPAPHAKADIPWLQLPVKFSAPVSGGLNDVRMVRRVETIKGQAPACSCDSDTAKKSQIGEGTGCPMASGLRLKVPYQAVYYFYKQG